MGNYCTGVKQEENEYCGIFQSCATNEDLVSVTERPDLGRMDILEFEQRVKMFAHPGNYGKVSF